jgi:uncharacterized repeat protein (TIGR01451 family)/fimbrial isopeptide formation D2 family protein
MSRGLWFAMSVRTRRGLVLLWTALFLCSLALQSVQLASPSVALAVHDEGLFEMDGDAVNGGAAGDDWEAVFEGTDSAFDTRFIVDPVDDDADKTYTGGSTKDDINISSWLWKNAKASQAKNDITHAFAAAYTAADGDTIAYFGLNKWEADGNNFVGFWFLKNTVAPTGSGNAPGSPFSGVHAVGDILVLASYTNGGSLADFDVYKWVGSGGNVNGTLQTVASGVPCTGGGGADDLACGATNGDTETAPWPYQGRDAEAGVFPPGTFFEGGINLTELGLDTGCFSTFFAETRASQSVDATLSDFANGQFSFCAPPDIETQVQNDQGNDTNKINRGESVTDHVVVSGDKGVAEGTVDVFVCGPTSSAQDCDNGGTQVGNDIELEDGEADSEVFTPTANGWYCFRVEYTPAAGSKYLAASHTNDTTECVRVIPADVQIVKTPNDGQADAGESITFTLNWTNEGEGAATGVVVSDTLPTGNGLDWSISNSSGSGSTCTLSAADVLTCNIGTIPGNPNFPDPAPVHGMVQLTSATTAATCGEIDNTGQITSANDGTDNDPGQITVDCPDVIVDKTPDDGSVNAGDAITWSIVATNQGAGSATGVVVSDDLPAGNDPANPLVWSESEADCSIVGAPGSQVLTCTVGTLAAGASSEAYTATATTASGDCGVVDNTATVSATNEPSSAQGNNSDDGDVTVLCADIEIVKTADADTVSAGDQIGFDIVVTNAGDGVATGVHVTDTLPTDAGVSWAIESVTGDGDPSCAITAGILTCDADALGPTESFTVHIVSPTTAATCGTVDNTAAVTTTNDGEDSSSDDVLVQCPDITVVKLADADPINAGDPIGFTITVSNAGPGTAYGVTLSDTLPSGITWSEDSTSCSIGAGVLSCTIGTLAPGATFQVHLTGTTDAADCGTITNTASVAATNEAASATGNNSSTDSVVVQCPDVEVVKTGNGPIIAGQDATFTITLTNTGAGDAYDVTLQDQLPAGNWTLGGADAAECQIDGSNLLTCDFGTVESGDSRVITVTKTTVAGDCPSLHNEVTVGASNEPTGAGGDDTDDADIVVNCPDLEVVKDGNGPISAGEDAMFTITVTNHGPGAAFDVTLEDDLPAGIEWALGGPNAAECQIIDGTPDVLSCDFGMLAVDASKSVTLTGETDAADCGSVPNLASASASNEDTETDQFPNSDDATIVVDCPEIVITKTADAPVVNAGDQIGFTITVTNTGAGAAFNVTVNDVLPTGMTWIESPDAAGWSISGGVLSFGPATLAANSSTSVHIVAMTDAADCGVVPNTALLTYQGGEGDDSSQVTVDCPDLLVVKEGNGPLVNGQTATFTITVQNLGPGVAYDATLEDQLPAGSWTLGGPDAADCAIDGSNLLSCEFGDIDAPGVEADHVRVITVSKIATTDDCGTIPNEVTVGASNEAEADTGNNASDDTIDVRCPDVDLEKEADDDLVEPNQVVTYTIDVTVLDGPVSNAVVTDELPDGQTYVDGSASPAPSSVSPDGKTITWTFVSLPSGDPAATITYDVTIDADATGDPQENIAEVCVDEDTPCASDVEIVTPQFPDIELVKTAGDAADGDVHETEPGEVTYTYEVTNSGPLTLIDVTVTDDAGTPDEPSDDVEADCPDTTLDPGESMTCTATIEVLVDTTNIAVARGVTVEGNPAEDDDPADVRILEHGLVIDKTNDAPLETLELPDGSTADLPTADEGSTVTYTLSYTFSGDPVSNGVIIDVLPLGVTYVDGSATSDAQFTFQGYDDTLRTLTWTAASVSASGSVTYQATIDEGAAELPQPLINVATIVSDQTGPDEDDSDVFVPTVPAALTNPPTLPPTDTLPAPPSQSNPGFTMMLVLFTLAGIVLAIGFVTPVPASVRERNRR